MPPLSKALPVVNVQLLSAGDVAHAYLLQCRDIKVFGRAIFPLYFSKFLLAVHVCLRNLTSDNSGSMGASAAISGLGLLHLEQAAQGRIYSVLQAD